MKAGDLKVGDVWMHREFEGIFEVIDTEAELLYGCVESKCIDTNGDNSLNKYEKGLFTTSHNWDIEPLPLYNSPLYKAMEESDD